MSNQNLQEKLQKVLDEAGINGSIMIVYEDTNSPIVNGMHSTGFVIASRNFTDTFAVGQFTQCIGRMVVEGAIKGGRTGLPNRDNPQSPPIVGAK